VRFGGIVSKVVLRLMAIGLVFGVIAGLLVQGASAVSTKTVDTTSPAPGQPITYTITIDESVDQHNGRAIVSGAITDVISAPFTFVAVTCSLSCTATTPAVGASGTITITGFGQSEGPHDPALTGTVTLVVAAPDAVGETFTNQACIDVFVSPTISEPSGCVSAPEVTTIAAPIATATATETPTATATSTATPSPTSTPTETPTSSPSPAVTSTAPSTATPTNTATASATPAPTVTSTPDEPDDAALGDAASTGDNEVTALPNTGAQGDSSHESGAGTMLDILVGSMILMVLIFQLWRARNLTIGDD
jgi:hypothetical protein